jgi:hypothetical protein
MHLAEPATQSGRLTNSFIHTWFRLFDQRRLCENVSTNSHFEFCITHESQSRCRKDAGSSSISKDTGSRYGSDPPHRAVRYIPCRPLILILLFSIYPVFRFLESGHVTTMWPGLLRRLSSNSQKCQHRERPCQSAWRGQAISAPTRDR